MQHRSHYILCVLMIFAGTFRLWAQVPAPPPPKVGATLEVLNQSVSGTDFFFDIYLSATPGSPGNLYLGTADFVFTFTNANFSSPVLSLEPGFCNFVPNNTGNAATCQALYEANISTEISNGNLVINLNTVTASNSTTLNNNIANITSSTGVHRLGRFKLSGISNPSGTAGLNWKLAPPNVFTDVYYYANNFNTYQAELTTVVPASAPLPLELLAFNAQALQNSHCLLDWKTGAERKVAYILLERSQDQSNWMEVARFLPQESGDYAFLDENVFDPSADNSPVFLYRLKIAELDGQISWSPIKRVIFAKNKNLVRIYPNPASDQVHLAWNIDMESPVTAMIYDIKGGLMLTMNLQPSVQNTIPLDRGFTSGEYRLVLTSAEGRFLDQFNLTVIR